MNSDSVLRSQPENDVVKSLSLLLLNLGNLYSVPDWSEKKAVDLAFWVFDNYKCERLEIIDRVLRNPPKGEKVWRLTPDTIREWMAIELEQETIKREREEHNKKMAVELNDIDLLLKEALDMGGQPQRVVRSMTEEDIINEGQPKPDKEKSYSKGFKPDMEAARMANLKILYGRKYTDLITGEVLPGSPSFTEFLASQTNL